MSSPHATVVVAHTQQVVDSLAVGGVDHIRGHVKILNRKYY